MSCALVIPVTAVGVRRLVLVPSPICPLELSPQQSTWPVVRRAQLCSAPPVTSTAGPGSVTATGTSAFVRVPSPACPASLRPQQTTLPPARTAHPWRYPSPRNVASVSPVTGPGVPPVPGVAPLPSAPSMFEPQQSTAPDARRPQPVDPPASICCQSVNPPPSTTGTLESVAGAPLPSWFEPSSPQQTADPSARMPHVK